MLQSLFQAYALRARTCIRAARADNGLAVLSVFGYLTIHTRQLDMIMADRTQVCARMDTMLSHCKNLLFAPQNSTNNSQSS